MQTASDAASSNLHYLGRAGLQTLLGLNIAFLDGTFDQAAFHNSSPASETDTGCAHYTQVPSLLQLHRHTRLFSIM